MIHKSGHSLFDPQIFFLAPSVGGGVISPFNTFSYYQLVKRRTRNDGPVKNGVRRFPRSRLGLHSVVMWLMEGGWGMMWCRLVPRRHHIIPQPLPQIYHIQIYPITHWFVFGFVVTHYKKKVEFHSLPKWPCLHHPVKAVDVPNYQENAQHVNRRTIRSRPKPEQY